MKNNKTRGPAELGGWTAWAADLWQPRNPLLLELGPGGELLVSRLRVAAAWMLLLAVHALPLDPARHGVHLAVATALLALAVVLHAGVSWAYAAWWPYVTVAVDVLAVSGLVVLAGPPAPEAGHVALGLLLVTLVSASLRHDPWLVAEAALFGGGALAYLGAARPWPLVLLACAAVLLAAGLARARHHHALHDTDPLTGLLRRETFEQWLHDEMQRSRRYSHHLALALFEIDHRHDLMAHSAARAMAVERSLATLLRRSLRGTDVVARHGSGLFALALPETEARVALPRLDALRATIISATRMGGEGGVSDVSVSAGVAGWPDDAGEPASLMLIAEQRLRDAHEAGGDRLVGPS